LREEDLPLTRLPPVRAGMRIGLFGGSFDPPHAGHRAVSLEALNRLGLDQVWWLVSPQNPLKPHAPADLGRRIAVARTLANHPRIKVTGIEAALGTTYTADTLRKLKARLPGVRLVWMMGADNLASFHRWRDWQGIAADIPIAVFNRPGQALRALSSPAARTLARARIRERDARRIGGIPPPAWVFLSSPHVPLSSTELRAKRELPPVS
jgi:nicotinate-nucleotide adenylyltransferase